ncbi:hypothetical protein ACNKHT_03305 [Shigella flexneri]
MKDLSSNTQALTGANTGGAIDGVSATDRSPYSKAEIFSLFAENNMELTDSTIVTPGLRSIITVLSAITGAGAEHIARFRR